MNPFACNPATATEPFGPEVLDRYLDHVKHLPPTPTLMIKLIELFRQSDRDADEIVQLARRDPALAAEVLRQCNNSFMGSAERVVDINEAVFRIGFHEVYRITLCLFALRAINPAGMANFPVEPLRRHAGITAIASGALAREVGEPEDHAFTTGLLHDIGKVALAVADPAPYAPLLAQHGFHGAALREAEEKQFGFNHSHIGARLLNRWEVPEAVSAPVWDHHQLQSPGAFEKPTAILRLANLMAHHIQDETPGDFFEQPGAGPAMEFLGLDAQRLGGVGRLVQGNLKHLPGLVPA